MARTQRPRRDPRQWGWMSEIGGKREGRRRVSSVSTILVPVQVGSCCSALPPVHTLNLYTWPARDTDVQAQGCGARRKLRLSGQSSPPRTPATSAVTPFASAILAKPRSITARNEYLSYKPLPSNAPISPKCLRRSTLSNAATNQAGLLFQVTARGSGRGFRTDLQSPRHEIMHVL